MIYCYKIDTRLSNWKTVAAETVECERITALTMRATSLSATKTTTTTTTTTTTIKATATEGTMQWGNKTTKEILEEHFSYKPKSERRNSNATKNIEMNRNFENNSTGNTNKTKVIEKQEQQKVTILGDSVKKT